MMLFLLKRFATFVVTLLVASLVVFAVLLLISMAINLQGALWST